MSGNSDIQKFARYFEPREKGAFKSEIYGCLKQIERKFKENNIPLGNIFKLSFFIDARFLQDFSLIKEIIRKAIEAKFTSIPSHSVIAQAPYKNNVAVEVFAVKGGEAIVENIEVLGRSVSVLKIGQAREYCVSGINSNMSGASAEKNAQRAFEEVSDILNRLNLSFIDIFRQWNYIEDLLGEDEQGNDGVQNYQAFNEIRSQFYSESDWLTGYPSATGIGASDGGVTIDFIAAKGESLKTYPLRNPEQSDAHKYTDRILAGKSKREKSTPKFERGRLVLREGAMDLYVSGTASIKGEDTYGKSNIKSQTLATLENIDNLISLNNAKSALGKDEAIYSDSVGLNNLSYARIYVKEEELIPSVKQLCDYYFCNVPKIYLIADICRDDLLVEIESAAFNLKIDF